MPATRCEFCTSRPYQEVAVQRSRGEDRDRLTIQICARHYQRLAKGAANGWEHAGFHWKLGFW